MKIATYNLEFLFGEGAHTHSGKEWVYIKDFVDARINHFAKAFSEIDADILFLQELGTEEVLQRILAKVNRGYSYFIGVPDKNGIGNAVIYKPKDCACASVPAKATLPVFVEGDEDNLGKRIWSRRDFVQVTTIYNGRPLFLIGLHLKSTFAMPEETVAGVVFPMATQSANTDGLIRSELFRLAQAKKVREMVDGFFANDPDAAIIVAGDFNARETDVLFRIVSGAIKDAPDVLISASKNLPEESRFSVFNRGNKKLIDHILISKTLEKNVLSVTIMNNDLKSRDDKFYTMSHVESDHAPMFLELR